jgi:hypothetical protein
VKKAEIVEKYSYPFYSVKSRRLGVKDPPLTIFCCATALRQYSSNPKKPAADADKDLVLKQADGSQVPAYFTGGFHSIARYRGKKRTATKKLLPVSAPAA